MKTIDFVKSECVSRAIFLRICGKMKNALCGKWFEYNTP